MNQQYKCRFCESQTDKPASWCCTECWTRDLRQAMYRDICEMDRELQEMNMKLPNHGKVIEKHPQTNDWSAECLLL